MHNNNLTIVTDESFAAEVLQAKLPVLVDFWAEWCGPCQMLIPTIEAIALEFSNKIKVVKVNVDENNQAAINYNVRSIPTLMLFKDGKIVATKMGVLTKAQLADFINTNLI